MENKTEDEIRKRWEQEAKEKSEREEELQQRPKKRVRAIEYSNRNGNSVLEESDMESVLDAVTGNGRAKAKGKGPAVKKTGRAAAARAKNNLTEMFSDDTVVELD